MIFDSGHLPLVADRAIHRRWVGLQTWERDGRLIHALFLHHWHRLLTWLRLETWVLLLRKLLLRLNKLLLRLNILLLLDLRLDIRLLLGLPLIIIDLLIVICWCWGSSGLRVDVHRIGIVVSLSCRLGSLDRWGLLRLVGWRFAGAFCMWSS